jgi:adenosylmethionine-8-amino-7-oxononanoate aminotransferase
MGTLFSRTERHDDDSDDITPSATPSAILHRNVTKMPLTVHSDRNNWLRRSNGTRVYDGSGGASVSNLGHGYKDRILSAMGQAYLAVDYVPSLFLDTEVEKALSVALIETTSGLFSKAIFYNSGTFNNKKLLFRIQILTRTRI